MMPQKNAVKVGIFVLQHDVRLLKQLELLRHAKVEVAAVVINEGVKRRRKPTTTRIHQVFRDVSGMTTKETLEHVFGILRRKLAAMFGVKNASKPSIYDRDVYLEQVATREDVAFIITDNHSSREVRDFLMRNEVNVAFLLSSGIIRQTILEIDGLKVFCAHPAILPKHRSLGSVVWSILAGDETGITVFQVDSGIDTGPIVFHHLVEPVTGDTLEGYRQRLFAMVPGLYLRTAELIKTGQIQLRPQNLDDGVHHAQPEPHDILRARKKLRERISNGSGPLKQNTTMDQTK